MHVETTFGGIGRRRRGVTALVPTMGALHAGHRSLLDLGRGLSDTLVASIWVNPLQFNDPADLAAYPSTLDADLAVCEAAGVDVVFAPTAEEMRTHTRQTVVTVGAVAERWEGAHRPGHFDGVATVVTQLLAGIAPDRAVFGRKDAQQLAVIRTLVADLALPVEVVAAPTVRDADGLALSSRNTRLSATERERALGISAALLAGADHVEAGGDPAAVTGLVGERLAAAGLSPEYVALVDAVTMESVETIEAETVLAVAARVGPVRLIDNVVLAPADGGVVADRGIRLAG